MLQVQVSSLLFDWYSGKYVVLLCVLFIIVAKYTPPSFAQGPRRVQSTGHWKYKIQISARGVILLCRTDLHADLKGTEMRCYVSSSQMPLNPVFGREG